MNTKEKKQYVLLTIVLLATCVVVYFNFFKKPSTSSSTTNILNSIGAVPTSTSESGASYGGILPQGANLDLKVLQNENFKNLVPPTYPVVSQEEVGSDNLFGK